MRPRVGTGASILALVCLGCDGRIQNVVPYQNGYLSSSPHKNQTSENTTHSPAIADEDRHSPVLRQNPYPITRLLRTILELPVLTHPIY